MLRRRSLEAFGYGGSAAVAAAARARANGLLLLRNHFLAFSSSSSAAAQPQEDISPQQQPPSSSSSPEIETLMAYHEQTKHHFHKYADTPHGLQWASQPDSFRRYHGASLIALRHLPPIYGAATDQQYSRIFSEFVNPSILTKAAVSQLLYDSLSLSAWKKAGPVSWSLRVNPSSGNLHPTEAYIVAGPMAGVSDNPFIAHYAPKEHALELRAEISFDLWRDLTSGFPPGTVFVGLTSVYWRELWKYGERGFRYCHQDIGHALGAIAMAGAAQGWDAVLLDGWGNEDIAHLLGVAKRNEMPAGAPKTGKYPQLEKEHAHCLVAFFPGKAHHESTIRGKHDMSYRSRPRDDSVYKMSNVTVPCEALVDSLRSRMAETEWKGLPNLLSKEHVWYESIDKAAAASVKPTTPVPLSTKPLPQWVSFTQTYLTLTLRQIINKRRSALKMDSNFVLQREAFYQIMWKSMPSGYNTELQGDPKQFPFRVLPWSSQVHMAIFVHKVIGLPKGLYFLVRNSEHQKQLREAMRPEFQWVKPEKCPEQLPLYLLAESNCEKLAMQLSCHQEIAGDSCFSIGMISRFDAIKEKGAWMYPRLFWECGVLGQLLYLEAHAVGISASGIGCYFDDPVHQVLGFKGKEWQSLYHFTIGAPVEDKRIMNLPGYPGPDGEAL